VGAHAVDVALASGTGYMATLLRQAGSDYRIRFGQVPLAEVANSERFLPAHWISADGCDVSDEFIRYAQPLLGDRWPETPLQDGLPRYARLKQVFLDKRCPPYQPVSWRKGS
jgi:6-phosphofructokinase 1